MSSWLVLLQRCPDILSRGTQSRTKLDVTDYYFFFLFLFGKFTFLGAHIYVCNCMCVCFHAHTQICK